MQVSNSKGTRTLAYNGNGEHRDLATGVTISGFGTITAGYDSDGALARQGYPNAMVQTVTRDETAARTGLTDIVNGATWLTDTAISSIHGQWRQRAGSLSAQTYSYHPAGRLSAVADTPATIGCATRTYGFDVNSNRLTSTSSPAAADNSCQASAGATSVTHTYDSVGGCSAQGPTPASPTTRSAGPPRCQPPTRPAPTRPSATTATTWSGPKPKAAAP